ncbi:hypothetical protein AVEN_21572-1 [Araneus ventricosus]|uniref:Reverse transcriptase domain-containing protein n=1 Tax=Araneus ventricosus TaxID=182803 RepID=A0A4Y2NSY1_ARAVE|nr:hypothetical protein AVEN_21572-1 [Araneus ventricosus]
MDLLDSLLHTSLRGNPESVLKISFSMPHNIKAGLIQLGPTCFNTYINDILQIVKTDTRLFADDTATHCINQHSNIIPEKLTEYLQNLEMANPMENPNQH